MSKPPPKAMKAPDAATAQPAKMSIWDELREKMDEFSAAERRVARVILTNTPTIGLETIAKIAKLADVSGPTVIRFVNRLGFDSFVEFQAAVRAELDSRMVSPVLRYGSTTPIRELDDVLGRHSAFFVDDIQRTFDSLPPSEFHAAVDLLADVRKRVWIVGGRYSHVLARYLHLHLQQLRPQTHLVGNEESTWAAAILDAGRRDVLVVFDFRRYQTTTIEGARAMAEAGASIILFTDRWLSPVAEVAEVVLPTVVESPTPFETLVPALAVVEATIAALVGATGEPGRQRIEEYERITERGVVRWGDGPNGEAER